MDILGYSELSSQAHKSGNDQELLRSVHAALSSGREWLEDGSPSSTRPHFGSKDHYALKAFTDNIVVAWPVRSNAESELGNAFFKLGFFQFQMVLAGYFVRGAIALNDAYVDEIAVFGPALFEAYEGESVFARDPRIVLTPSAVVATRKHVGYYTDPRSAPQVRNVLQDVDGHWFVNYLECILWAEDEHGPFLDELLSHKTVVEGKLTQYKDRPSIWAKYAWVAMYHNYFCDLHAHHFGDAHKIDVNSYVAGPSLIA